MTFASHFSTETAGVFRNLYDGLVNGGPIIVAMPMFVFISGFLFGGQLMKSQPITFGKLIRSKFMRLMIPFFLFTVIFMFTTNSVSWKPFYQWSFWHLWFLPMLFWCFIVTYLLRPLIMSNNYWVSVSTLAVLFGISLIGIFMPKFLGLHGVHHWYCWFALGAWFYKHESLLNNRAVKINVTVWGGVSYLLLSVLFPQEYGTNSIMSYLISICGMSALWCGINLINWRDNKFTSLLVGLSGASFGIYIFHNWIEMYIVSSTAQRVFPLERFALAHTLLFPFLFATIAFILSYIISFSLLRTKIGKQLIG